MQESKNGVRSRGDGGFTLIELLVVIVVLGILAAVVVFAVGGITDRGKSSSCKTELATVQTAIEAYNGKKGFYPDADTPEGLGAILQAEGLISESTDLPGAAPDANYVKGTGSYTATCPTSG